MQEVTTARRPLAGLLTAQFFGAFNDNALKLLVALLAGGVAAAAETGAAAKEMATQTQTTIAFVVFTLPLMLFSLPSALLADRFSKRSIIIGMKILELAVMVVAMGVLWRDPTGGMWIFLTLGLMGLQSAIFSPAKYGIMPQLCDEASLTKGNGLLELWTFLAIIFGYGAGGALLDLTKPEGAVTGPHVYVAMVVLVAISAVGLIASFAVPRVPAVAGVGSRPIGDAWRAIRSSPSLRLVIAGQTVFWLLASLLSQDVLTYAKQVLGETDTMAGVPFVAFGIGIGVGSVVAGRVSNHGIEPGLIPIGAIGLALGTTAMGVIAPGFWITLVLMLLLGMASGLLIVPLEAMLQWYAPEDKRGAVIAIANVPIFFGVMVGSLVVYFLAIVGGYSSTSILVIAGVLTVLATAWALWLLPQALLRMVFVMVTNTLYRLRVEGRENVPETGPGLLVANHVSLVDWLFLVASVDRPIRFLVDSSYFHSFWLRPFMRVLGAIPVSAGSPRELMRAMKDAGQYLRNGELVCIFAEGEISRTGALLPFRRGLTRILKGNDQVPVIPAHLDQIWGSPFSPRGGGFLRSWNGPIPRPVTLSFGAPLPADTPVAEIRDQVKLLDAKAWEIRQESRPPLHHALVRACRRGRLATALSDATGRRVSRFKLLAGAIGLAHSLREAWSGQERVGVLLPPSIGGVLTNCAASFAGKASVNLNYTTGPANLASSAAQAGLRTVVTSREFLARAEVELPDDLTPIWLEEVIAGIGAGTRFGAAWRALCAPIRWLERFAGMDAPITNRHEATLIFSSGSTGEPKGVPLTHSNIDANSEAVAQVLGLRRSDRMLAILPQFHSFGYMSMWFALNHRVGMVCHPNPVDAAAIGPMVRKEKVTIMIATPTFLQVYLRRCAPGDFGALRLVITGAEKLPPATADAFEDRFGVRPSEGYGTTECSPVVAVATSPYRAPGFFQGGGPRGTIGQPLPGVAVRIVDPDTFEARPTGESGMLVVRGPNVMDGYLGLPERTAEVLRDGWYHTGDLAFVDEEGFIRITDRLSRFSKIGGEMVPHGKVEQALHEAAGRSDEQVFVVTGVPDPKKGERLMVIHTLEEDAIPGILQKVRESGLPNLFVPRPDQFVKVDAVPVLGTGKTDLKAASTLARAAAGIDAADGSR